MGFENFSKLEIRFELEGFKISVINANHGVFSNTFQRHMHPFCELHYIVGGDGRLVLDDSEHSLSAGMLFMTTPGVYHTQLTNPSNPMEEFVLSFEAIQQNTSNRVREIFKDGKTYISNGMESVLSLFEEVEHEINNRSLSYVSAIKSLINFILIKSLRKLVNPVIEPINTVMTEERRNLLLDEAFLYSFKDLTLSDLSEILGLDTRQIQRIISRRYGMTFIEMRTHSRLNAAQTMITDGRGTLEEIASICGFENYPYFSRRFKEKFGILPSEYKKARKED